MTVSSAEITWNLESLSDCYSAIQYGNADCETLIQSLSGDLKNILVIPKRNDKSRTALSSGKNGAAVKFHNGQEFKLNEGFITAACELSAELDLDELAAAELLQGTSNSVYSSSFDLRDAGILCFYQRLNYIINIVGYVITNRQLSLIAGSDPKTTLSTILASFKQIYALVSIQNDLIDKQRATGDINDLQFTTKITYARKQLFELHGLLAQTLYSLLDNYITDLGTYETYLSIISHIDRCIKDDADLLILHYLPVLLRVVTSPVDLNDKEVTVFHSKFVSSLKSDHSKVCTGDSIDISQSSSRPYALFLQLAFFISLIPWLKKTPTRGTTINIEADVLTYIEWLINYGMLEQLLCFTAETTNPKTKFTFDEGILFDFRPLLQKSFPKLTPSIFVYPKIEELEHISKTNTTASNVFQLCDYSSLSLSEDMCESLLAPSFHSFFCDFINYSAVVLTSLRDSEEDFLLSSINESKSEFDSGFLATKQNSPDDMKQNMYQGYNYENDSSGLNLDEISVKSELERFYLAFAYTYSNRSELCKSFWSLDEENIMGFISWGLANNTSPLIVSTFCLLLGSLAYGGNSSSSKLWEILNNTSSGLSKCTDYSQISVDSIIASLSYYVNAMEENLGQDGTNSIPEFHDGRDSILLSNKFNKDRDVPLTIELSEDSMVFIAGFLILISNIAENSSSDLTRQIFGRFHQLITSVLQFDNLLTSAKLLQSEGSAISSLLENEDRIALVNLMMNLLAKFADGNEDLDLRCKIWVIVDKWICHSFIGSDANASNAADVFKQPGNPSSRSLNSKLKSAFRGITISRSFNLTFTSVSEVFNFSKLIESLLTPTDIEEEEEEEEELKATSTIRLLYPSDLGASYRYQSQIGVWPYIEFMIKEVLGKSAHINHPEMKRIVQLSILRIAVLSFREVDWNLLYDLAPEVSNQLNQRKEHFSTAFSASGERTVLSLNTFSRLHHSLAILNYFFEDSASNALFGIIDDRSTDDGEDSRSLTIFALEIVKKILGYQRAFIDKLLPILKNSDGAASGQSNVPGYGTSFSLILSQSSVEYNNIYYPDDVGTKGLNDYYEMMLFHIPSIARIAQYVGSSNSEIAMLSLGIFRDVSNSRVFAANKKYMETTNSPRNRLLNILENIDESKSIQFCFVQQLENMTGPLEVKFSVLKFILESLPSAKEVTVAHFLLGFKIKANKLYIEKSVNSSMMLRSLLTLCISSLEAVSQVDYGGGFENYVGAVPAKLVSLVMEVVIKLCRNPISSQITLAYLREFDLFGKLMKSQPKIDNLTKWHTEVFDGDLQDGHVNPFVQNDVCTETFLNFVTFRNSALQYLSLEFHDVSSRSQKEHYIDLFLDKSEFLNSTAKILNFLDVLNFEFYNFDELQLLKYAKSFNIENLFLKYQDDKESMTNPEQFLLDLTALECQVANVDIIDEEARLTFTSEAKRNTEQMLQSLKKVSVVRNLRAGHFETIHAWVQIIQILAHDGVNNKTDFVLQVFQIVLPKINNEYYERDVLFAEELISLCLFLYDLYVAETETESEAFVSEEAPNSLHGLVTLFKTCITGLLDSNSTASLRSDLYLLMNKFIQRGLKRESLLKEILKILRCVDPKLVDIVCNDSIYSEGMSRITSILLLESLVNLSCAESSTLIISALTKSNFLSLLIRSLKRVDEIISACSESGVQKEDSGINFQTLFYELTAFKSTLYVLIRIAQTRQGASQLVQNEVFLVLHCLKFVTADADLGLQFRIERGDSRSASIKLTLDVPLTLREWDSHAGQVEVQTLSLHEILIPIFQLIATVLLSMGPSYVPGICQAEKLMQHYNSLVLGVMKRDTILEEYSLHSLSEHKRKELKSGIAQLVNLFTLIASILP